MVENQTRSDFFIGIVNVPFCSCLDGIDLLISELLFFDIISGEICRGVLSLVP
ncbi:hypothetical protein PMEGAPL128_61510 [Priestia megaterium]